MKKAIMFALSCLVGSYANAETHGAVETSNAQFQAVANYALGEAGDLERVLGIKKVREGGDCALFEVSLGGMNQESGKESVSRITTLQASFGESGLGKTSEIRVSEATSEDCK